MAGENQYINPIIEAMVRTANNARDAASLAEKTRQSKAEEAFRQSQLAQQESQFEKDHELRQREADVAAQHMKALIEGLHIQNVGQLHGLASSGVDLGKIFGQGNGGEGPTGSYAPQTQIPTVLNPNVNNAPLGVNVPGVGGGIDPSAFGSPETQNRIVYNQAKAQAGGVAEGSAPTHEAQAAADFSRMVTLHSIDAERNKEVERMRADSAKEVERMRASAMLSAAQIRANLGARIDPEEIVNAYRGVITGQTGFSTLPKEIKVGVLQLAGQRGTALPTNQKQYSDNLNQVSGIEDLIRQYKDLALNYSRDAEGSNVLYKMPLINGTQIPYTDLKSKSDALKAQGGALASFFDKQNRKSDAEILRQFSGLFDPKSTIKQNLDKINSHVSVVKKGIKNTFAGINPEDINMITNDRGLTEIGDMNESPAAPSGGSIEDRLVQKHGGR